MYKFKIDCFVQYFSLERSTREWNIIGQNLTDKHFKVNITS